MREWLVSVAMTTFGFVVASAAAAAFTLIILAVEDTFGQGAALVFYLAITFILAATFFHLSREQSHEA